MKLPPILPLAALTLLALTAPSRAATPIKEDLRNCTLPHGELTLPAAPDADKGSFLKLSDGSFFSSPDTWQNKKPEAVAALKSKNQADLAYLPDNDGTLWAISGRVIDLGAKYLYEAAAMKLDRPEFIPGEAHQPAGMIKAVKDGRSFLLETADGHFALIRVLDAAPTGLTLQYVYQPSGTTQFTVKPSDLVEVFVPASRQNSAPKIALPPGIPVPAPTGALNTAPTPPHETVLLEPPFSNHMRQRTMMIERRLKILQADAKTPSQIATKTDAIDELAQLHADEAAPELVKQLTFLNERGTGDEFQDAVHPCFAALKHLGKAGSNAALKALRDLDLNTTATGLDAPDYKAGLLALVIRSVEGDDLAMDILRRERAAAKDPKRQAMYDQLINPTADKTPR